MQFSQKPYHIRKLCSPLFRRPHMSMFHTIIVQPGMNPILVFVAENQCHCPFLPVEFFCWLQIMSIYLCVWFENRKSLVRSPAGPVFFPTIDESHCSKIRSSLTAVHCPDGSYVEKQQAAWKEYCAECWLKEL